MDSTLSPARDLEPTKAGSPEGPDAAAAPTSRRGFPPTAADVGGGQDGMYGMVTALVVQDPNAAVEPAAAGVPACSFVTSGTT